MSNSLWLQELYSPWNSLGQNARVGSLPFLQGIPNPGIEPRSPTLQVDSSPAEPQRKPKNTAVSSLFLLQRIFPTQELNQGLLHCRQILLPTELSGKPSTLMGIWQISECCQENLANERKETVINSKTDKTHQERKCNLNQLLPLRWTMSNEQCHKNMIIELT